MHSRDKSAKACLGRALQLGVTLHLGRDSYKQLQRVSAVRCSIPLMVMVSGVGGVGGGATPLVTGFPGVLNIRSVKENVPLSTVSNLKRLSSFQAAVSISSSLPAHPRHCCTVFLGTLQMTCL